MFRYLLFVFFFFNYLLSGEITTEPTQFPNSTSQASWQSACCFILQTNQIVFSWASLNNNLDPWYAIYDVASKSFSTPPTQIAKNSYTRQVLNGVYCCYNSETNQVVFSWASLNDSYDPWYAVYDVASKSFSTPPTQIDPSGYTSQVYGDVFCCYNSSQNKVIFSWADLDPPRYGWYSILNMSTKTLKAPVKISNQTVYNNVYALSDNKDLVVFSWANQNRTHAYGAKLNLTTKNLIDFAIPTNSSGSAGDVFCCYDSVNNSAVFSWADRSSSSTFRPWYIIYDLNNSLFVTKSPKLISDAPYEFTNFVPTSNVYSCFNSANNQIVFSWGAIEIGNVYYAIYDRNKSIFTTPATEISTNYTNSLIVLGVYCCYDSRSNQTFFTWSSNNVNGSGYNPWYAIYTESFPPSILLKNVNHYTPLKNQKSSFQ